jgi:hypothetical protein
MAMWTDRLRIKRSLTLMWLALAAALMLAARFTAGAAAMPATSGETPAAPVAPAVYAMGEADARGESG